MKEIEKQIREAALELAAERIGGNGVPLLPPGVIISNGPIEIANSNSQPTLLKRMTRRFSNSTSYVDRDYDTKAGFEGWNGNVDDIGEIAEEAERRVQAREADEKFKQNETTKLFAGFLDRAATTCLTVGVITPIGAYLFGLPGSNSHDPWVSLIYGACFFFAAGVLHYSARTVLKGLRA